MDQEQHYTVYAPSLQAHNRIRTNRFCREPEFDNDRWRVLVV